MPAVRLLRDAHPSRSLRARAPRIGARCGGQRGSRIPEPPRGTAEGGGTLGNLRTHFGGGDALILQAHRVCDASDLRHRHLTSSRLDQRVQQALRGFGRRHAPTIVTPSSRRSAAQIACNSERLMASQCTERLVHEQHTRSRGDSSGERHALSLTS